MTSLIVWTPKVQSLGGNAGNTTFDIFSVRISAASVPVVGCPTRLCRQSDSDEDLRLDGGVPSWRLIESLTGRRAVRRTLTSSTPGDLFTSNDFSQWHANRILHGVSYVNFYTQRIVTHHLILRSLRNFAWSLVGFSLGSCLALPLTSQTDCQPHATWSCLQYIDLLIRY